MKNRIRKNITAPIGPLANGESNKYDYSLPVSAQLT